MLNEGVDYNFLFPEDDPKSIHVSLTTGKYSGVVYKYGAVNIQETNGQGLLQFNYKVVTSPKISIKDLEKDPSFKEYIGDFLMQIITANLEQEAINDTQED